MPNIKAVLVAESRLDRSAFLSSASQITGQNHARSVDKETYRSIQAGDIDIVSDFCGQHIGRQVFYLGFLVGGLSYQVRDVIERASAAGMTHVNADLDNPLAMATIIMGSVSQWAMLMPSSCQKDVHQHIREVFTQIYHIMCQRGLQTAFSGYKRQNQPDGTILLLAN